MADEDTNMQNTTDEAPVEETHSDEENHDEAAHVEEPTIEPEETAEAEAAHDDTSVEAGAEEKADEAENPAGEVETKAESEEATAKDSEAVKANEPAATGEDVETPAETTEEPKADSAESSDESKEEEEAPAPTPKVDEASKKGRWYVVHTFSGHENRVAATLKQRIESEHLENLIFDILVPTQDKIEIRGGKKETVKEKIFPGYILVKMDLSDESWLAVRTTQGVTSFVGAGNKPTPITDMEVNSIVKFTSQGAQPTFKEVFMVDDTVKIIDGPFADFIGKVDSVDTEKGRVRVLVSIFGRETPVELDFLQVTKL